MIGDPYSPAYEKVGMWEFSGGFEKRPRGTPDASRIVNHDPRDLPLMASIRGRGRLTLPKAARHALSLSEGDRIVVVVGRNTIELIPADLVAREELWTLTGSIRSRIEAAEDDVSSGRTAEIEDSRSLRGAASRLRRMATDGS